MFSELSIGIIIPVFNEAKNIKLLLPRVITQLTGTTYTICIVDDGSQDETVSIVREFMTIHPEIHLIQRIKTRTGCQRGGASFHALHWLINNTTHEVIAEIDADGAHPPEELCHGAQCMRLLAADVAIASKYVYGSIVKGRSLSRRFISFFYSVVARILFNYRIRDYSNSFRFYSRSAVKHILQLKPRYTSPIYLLEILVMLIAGDFQIVELPTQYVERDSGTSKVKWIDLMKGFVGMLDIAIRFHFKKYDRWNNGHLSAKE